MFFLEVSMGMSFVIFWSYRYIYIYIYIFPGWVGWRIVSRTCPKTLGMSLGCLGGCLVGLMLQKACGPCLRGFGIALTRVLLFLGYS